MKIYRRVQSTWTQLPSKQRRLFRQRLKAATDARLRTRYQIVLALVQGRSPSLIAQLLCCSLALVYKVADRFLQEGEAGLIDRREDNGPEPVPWIFHSVLRQVVAKSPQDYGYHRPSWTLELLVQVLAKKTGRTVSPSTMSRLLKENGIRRKRPKAWVACPWPEGKKQRRLRRLRRLARTLPRDEVLLHEDEVDIHLNPKIGPDYMLRGQQKKVRTPGINEKRYVAGGLEWRNRRLVWVEWENKSSDLFIMWLWEIHKAYPKAKKIHVILDNVKIHKSQRTRLALRALAGRVRLHWLPPYSPDDNPIERLWEDLHANVTRNHKCRTMAKLMKEVHWYLQKCSLATQKEHQVRKAA